MVTGRAPAGKTGELGPCPDPSRSSALAPSCRRWPPSTPTSSPPPAVADRASSSCRRRPSLKVPRIMSAGRNGGSGTLGALGAEVEAIAVLGRSSADDESSAQAIGEADLVYLAGGEPRSDARGAHRRRGLGRDRRRPRPRRGRRRLLGGAMALSTGSWPCAAGCCRGRSAGATGSRWSRDRGPAGLRPMPSRSPRSWRSRRRVSTAVLGLDEGTAIVGRDGSWRVHVRPAFTVWRGAPPERLHAASARRRHTGPFAAADRPYQLDDGSGIPGHQGRPRRSRPISALERNRGRAAAGFSQGGYAGMSRRRSDRGAS